MKIIYFLLALLVLIAGCKNADTTGLAVADLCNDNNPCTKDTSLNGKCINEILESCCGNNKCEIGEGCNSITKTTSCNKDCSLCPAEIKIKTIGCKDSCVLNQDNSMKVIGNSELNFEIENNGEETAEIKTEFNCVKTGQYVGSINFGYYGLNVEYAPSLILNGKSKTPYKVILTGKPTISTSFECSVNLFHKNNIIIETVFLRLEN